MGWSSSEDLLCVQEDGNILVYNLFGASVETVHCRLSSVSPKYPIVNLQSAFQGPQS